MSELIDYVLPEDLQYELLANFDVIRGNHAYSSGVCLEARRQIGDAINTLNNCELVKSPLDLDARAFHLKATGDYMHTDYGRDGARAIKYLLSVSNIPNMSTIHASLNPKRLDHINIDKYPSTKELFYRDPQTGEMTETDLAGIALSGWWQAPNGQMSSHWTSSDYHAAPEWHGISHLRPKRLMFEYTYYCN